MDKWFEQAKETIQKLPCGKKFEVRFLDRGKNNHLKYEKIGVER